MSSHKLPQSYHTAHVSKGANTTCRYELCEKALVTHYKKHSSQWYSPISHLDQ